MGRIEDLEKRIRILEDIEEIKKMKSRYVYCLDERDWDGVLEYFAEDVKADLGAFGKHEGKKKLGKFFKEDFPPVTSFTLHMTQDPIIEINGDKANGRWYMHSANTFSKNNEAVWGGVRYDDEFIKEKGKWKCNSFNVHIFYITPYDKGWARKKLLDEIETKLTD